MNNKRDTSKGNPGTVSISIGQYKESNSSLAANIIVERLQPRILAFARKKLLGNKNLSGEAESLVNETFARLFAKLRNSPEDVNDSAHLWNLLCKALVNKINDEYKRLGSKKRGEGRERNISEEAGEGLENLAVAHFDVDLDMETRELVDQVYEFIERMDDASLLIIYKGKIENKSNKEIGDSIGVSGQTVRRKWQDIMSLAIENFDL